MLLLAAGLACGAGLHAAAEDAAAGPPAAATSGAVEGIATAVRRREWMTDPRTMFRLYVASGLFDPGVSLESRYSRDGAGLRPIMVKTIPPPVRRALVDAFPLALQRLGAAPECRSLYEELGTDGALALATTVYIGPRAGDASALCTTLSASAYTRVGQQTTVVCPAFARLCRRRAAAALLHEALHYAGMTESPGDPTALTSLQITELVRDRCGL